jgi:hypothetical protein
VLLLVFLPVLRGLARPAAVGVAMLIVAAIGFSRVALGVHFVSDVLAGYVLGAAWVASMVALFNFWRRESGQPAVDPVRGLEPENAGRLDPRSSGIGSGVAPAAGLPLSGSTPRLIFRVGAAASGPGSHGDSSLEASSRSVEPEQVCVALMTRFGRPPSHQWRPIAPTVLSRVGDAAW